MQVELIGHDFTGLGFNICGNMRDGIFIKDLMNRGPAVESGKVKVGEWSNLAPLLSCLIACS